MSPDPAPPRIAYRVLTPRLELRCYEPGDAPSLVDAMKDGVDHMRPYLPWASFEPQTVDEKAALMRTFRGRFDLDQDYIFGAFDRSTRSYLLGGTGIHLRVGPGAAEIGYWMRNGHEGRGIATEMAAAMTRVGFELMTYRKMAIHCNVANTASARVAEKLGYAREGVIRQSIPHEGSIMADRLVFGLLASEYPASPAASMQIEAFDALRRRLM